MNSNAKQRHALQSIAANLWSRGFVEGLRLSPEGNAIQRKAPQGTALQRNAPQCTAPQSNAASPSRRVVRVVFGSSQRNAAQGIALQSIEGQCTAKQRGQRLGNRALFEGFWLLKASHRKAGQRNATHGTAWQSNAATAFPLECGCRVGQLRPLGKGSAGFAQSKWSFLTWQSDI